MNSYFKIFTLLSALVLTACSGGSGSDNSPFITTWKTDNEGMSNDNQISITTATSDQNYTVDWGDGSEDSGVTGDITHTYNSAGTYTVSISGDLKNIQFDNDTDYQKLLSVEQWGDTQWTTMEKAFYGCLNMVVNATDIPDLSNVTNFSSMFTEARAFNADLSNWNVSSATNMDSMFMRASKFDSDISGWDVSSVTDMGTMFEGATIFNADISQWNVSSVTDMGYMFKNTGLFNQDITDWDVSSVTSMAEMFRGTAVFNQDISKWADDMSLVTNMNAMFYESTAFNKNIGNWNVSSVTNMNSMFKGAAAFNSDIGQWDVSSVIYMSYMFKDAQVFNQNIGSWDVTSVTSMENMFQNTTLSTANYDALLNGWAAQIVQNDVIFSGGNSTYSSAASTAKSALETTYNWTITDGGLQ
jgi:surface protein